MPRSTCFRSRWRRVHEGGEKLKYFASVVVPLLAMICTTTIIAVSIYSTDGEYRRFNVVYPMHMWEVANRSCYILLGITARGELLLPDRDRTEVFVPQTEINFRVRLSLYP